MRDDFKGDLPGIRATDEDRVGAVSPGRPGSAPEPPLVRAVREPVILRQRNGALWAVCVCLLLALIGLGYWSHQQQRLLQQQLVATQESFARISEDAAGRLQDISGKVIATESSLSEREKERIRQINELEEKVGELTAALQEQEQLQQRQQQTLQTATQHLQELRQATDAQSERLAELDRLEAVIAQLDDRQQQQQRNIAGLEQQSERAEQQRAALDSGLAEAAEQLRQLEQLSTIKEQLAEQQTQLARQRGQLQALLDASTATSVEQQRLDAVDDALRSIDSFRVQTNRTLSTLQTQIGNLQQQMSQR